ncbi:MAG: four helix bundle protein [Paludibacter sp.]|nr:four helix bundle protein [Paludibacter sp.]
MNGGYQDFRDLLAYKKAFEQTMTIFENTKSFPKEEKYALIDQIRRSSRSVCANLAEAFRKRIYPNHFLLKITDCLGENSETLVWLDISLECEYIDKVTYDHLILINEEVGKLLSYMYNHPEKFGVIRL